MKRFIPLLIALFIPAAAHAELGDLLVDDGDTSPEEQTLEYFTEKYDYSNGKSMACSYGYAATKSGNHEAAKKIFDKCVSAGVAMAYPWQSYLAQNGYGVTKSLKDAAEWDRKSAESGYAVGEFNHGLNLLRGHGVKKDETAGRAMMDAAAAQGFAAAQEVIDSGYDPMVAVPDADEPRIW